MFRALLHGGESFKSPAPRWGAGTALTARTEPRVLPDGERLKMKSPERRANRAAIPAPAGAAYLHLQGLCERFQLRDFSSHGKHCKTRAGEAEG